MRPGRSNVVDLNSPSHSDMHLVFCVLTYDEALMRRIRGDGAASRRVLMVYKYRGADNCLWAAWRWQSVDSGPLLRRLRAYYGKRLPFETVRTGGSGGAATDHRCGLVCTVIDGCAWGCPANTLQFGIASDDPA